MKIKAQEITDLPPGSRVRLLDREWVRMTDWPDLHVMEYICDPQSGHIYHWASLCYYEDEVELIKRGEVQ